MVTPIPDEYRSPTPYLIISDAAKAIAFYAEAFDAIEFLRLADSTGKVMHAEIRINGTPLMLADEFPDMGYRGPKSLGGSPVSILVYVNDVDAQFRKAITAGAKEMMPVQDQFDGDRRGTLMDPFGHVWSLATRKQDVSLEEIKKRFNEMLKQKNV